MLLTHRSAEGLLLWVRGHMSPEGDKSADHGDLRALLNLLMHLYISFSNAIPRLWAGGIMPLPRVVMWYKVFRRESAVEIIFFLSCSSCAIKFFFNNESLEGGQRFMVQGYLSSLQLCIVIT